MVLDTASGAVVDRHFQYSSLEGKEASGLRVTLFNWQKL